MLLTIFGSYEKIGVTMCNKEGGTCRAGYPLPVKHYPCLHKLPSLPVSDLEDYRDPGRDKGHRSLKTSSIAAHFGANLRASTLKRQRK